MCFKALYLNKVVENQFRQLSDKDTMYVLIQLKVSKLFFCAKLYFYFLPVWKIFGYRWSF